ncbi:uncharacterized protein TRIVIDRAFT_61617 [Trichoderma virens Gv29-8]|uniref:Uncharacterized protein n=1 Tax=Hypocrea virens (strain Gv29-8 / FGSC 10586) TaxID=413071 RepID=G9MKW4_HYPVG|nr:uncharacterized protein TRIVIDRAFT_61617 [Trichoderma virens Gv29-8]EHK24860.1 hypothetical protein TRIVIDRAFT_61617 [Trichoderma virens Gv29-8]
MPFVGDDVHRATKRKWDHDKAEAFRLSHSAIHVLNQHATPESGDAISTRKTLPPTKRFRPIHDDDNVHALSSHRRTPSRELAQGIHGKGPVKINGMVLMPCHVCHRRPTKKSDLDSFARCQSCQEQTCFVCMRECQGQNSNKGPVLEDEDVLSRSFHMDDADECMTPPIPDTNEQKYNNDNDSNGRQGVSGSGKEKAATKPRLEHRTEECI